MGNVLVISLNVMILIMDVQATYLLNVRMGIACSRVVSAALLFAHRAGSYVQMALVPMQESIALIKWVALRISHSDVQTINV